MTRYKAKVNYLVPQSVEFEFELDEDHYEPSYYGARDQAYDYGFDTLNLDDIDDVEVVEIE